MAALLHPGPQTQVPADGAKQPPAPPPVIPFTQFQTLPKKHTPHRSPVRGPQPPRPLVNMPVAQRHQQVQHRPTNHHPQRGHMHVDPHRHANGRGHPAHFTHPEQMSLLLRLVEEVQSVCLDHSFISLPIPCSHLYVTSDEQTCCSLLDTSR
ncbi:hypothetical protein NQZ68_021067 [Dissostichus eleginoides]|nr:hypothetical protein NQZ68_021067 [Dissostichus eleginoides]